MRKRPKYTPDMALDQALHQAAELIRAIQWDYEGCCQMCGARSKAGHAERCSIRDVLRNLEQHMDLINS